MGKRIGDGDTTAMVPKLLCRLGGYLGSRWRWVASLGVVVCATAAALLASRWWPGPRVESLPEGAVTGAQGPVAVVLAAGRSLGPLFAKPPQSVQEKRAAASKAAPTAEQVHRALEAGSLAMGPDLPGLQAATAIRPVMRMFANSASVALADKNYQQAAQNLLDLIRLGAATSRGGNATCYEMGAVCVFQATTMFPSLLAGLGSGSAEELARELQQVQGAWESAEAAVARSLVTERSASVPMAPGAAEVLRQRMVVTEQAVHVHLDLCRAALHARSFEARTGHLPESLDAIASALTSGALEDRFSRKRLVYRKTNDGFLLYSVGPDHKDDGGRPMERSVLSGWPPSTGDIVLRYSR